LSVYSRQPFGYLSFLLFLKILSSFVMKFDSYESNRTRAIGARVCKEFSRIVCVSLFSYQGSLLFFFATAIIGYHIFNGLSRTFLFIFSSSFFEVAFVFATA
jgi:hypothetical protein